MKNIINILLVFFKYILLVAAFSITLFIIIRMNIRLEKQFMDSIDIFIPYLIIFILFIINLFIRRTAVLRNIYYNLTCNLVFVINIVAGLRAIMDKNMLFNIIQKMDINFNYFNNYLSFNKIMIYGLAVANIIFMIIPNEKKIVEETATLSDKSKTKVTKKTKKSKIKK